MLRRIKQWLRILRRHRHSDELDSDSGLADAMHTHLASNRLVRIQAARSAKALKKLSDLLALRAKAIDSITAAEEALAALDREEHDDK